MKSDDIRIKNFEVLPQRLIFHFSAAVTSPKKVFNFGSPEIVRTRTCLALETGRF